MKQKIKLKLNSKQLISPSKVFPDFTWGPGTVGPVPPPSTGPNSPWIPGYVIHGLGQGLGHAFPVKFGAC